MAWLHKLVAGGAGYAVAGPAGALIAVGATSSREQDGYDMSGIPFGAHVEAAHEDSERGRRWRLDVLSEVPAHCYATIRLLDDAGQAVPGYRPYCDEAGAFHMAAPVTAGRCSLFVPRGAARYASPRYLSLEVTLWDATSSDEAGSAPKPLGKAVLDARMPPAASLSAAQWWRPVVGLCVHALAALGRDAANERQAMARRLAVELQVDAGSLDGDIAQPPSIEEVRAGLAQRFAGVPGEHWSQLLRAVCTGEGVTPEQQLAIERFLAADS